MKGRGRADRGCGKEVGDMAGRGSGEGRRGKDGRGNWEEKSGRDGRKSGEGVSGFYRSGNEKIEKKRGGGRVKGKGGVKSGEG